MKNKRQLTMVLVVLLVIGMTYLTMDYFSQQKKQATLNSVMDVYQQALSSVPTPTQGLEKVLEASSALNAKAVQAVSKSDLNTADIINSLLSKADEYGLTLIPVTAQTWNVQKVGESEYKILPVELQVTGNLDSFISFTRAIEDNQKYPFLLIAGMSVQSVRADNLVEIADPNFPTGPGLDEARVANSDNSTEAGLDNNTAGNPATGVVSGQHNSSDSGTTVSGKSNLNLITAKITLNIVIRLPSSLVTDVTSP